VSTTKRLSGWIHDLKGIAVIILLLFLLNSLLLLFLWLPEYNPSLLVRISPELCILFFLLMILSLLDRRGKARPLLLFLGFLLTLFIIFSAGEAVTRHLYRRSFNPWVDLRFVREVQRLLIGAKNPLMIWFYSLAAVAVFIGILFGVFYLLRGVVKRLQALNHFVFSFLLIAGFFLLVGVFFGFGELIFDDFFKGITSSYSYEKVKPAAPEKLSLNKNGNEERGYVFPRLLDRNILLFVVESYGYTAYEKKDHMLILEPLFVSLEAGLRAHGYSIQSNFLLSPVIGGYSWFADSTFLTGQKIKSQKEYEAMLRSETQSMIGIFNEAGYTTVLAAPGTLQPWPEGEEFFGFDRYYYAKDFDYRGPEFSFVHVTDQYTIYKLHQEIMEKRISPPYFIEYLLVSSHAPFNKIPAYIENWETLGDGTVYNTSKNLSFQNTWFAGKQYTEGYTAAIKYVLTVITEYLNKFIHDGSLVIIIGDHQPKYPVTDKGQPLSVPIHIVCRDRSLLKEFVLYGFTRGFIPSQSPPHPEMAAFFPLFMEIINEKYIYNEDW
jgi:hypothetical protein